MERKVHSNNNTNNNTSYIAKSTNDDMKNHDPASKNNTKAINTCQRRFS
ncbi:7145_t:CDS:2 [Gigaspora margarita]|uniref:7145_t:CDS:1 n=1 Tax=Gigaspora margarita TaxID=4874 RepID=A0ABM8VYS5_GIGMA|nr:7145_t:CDS:2 [Gigaspora margarita]